MVDTSSQGIGNRIRKRRKARGLSQTKLAKLLNIPQQTIGGWETGKAERPRYLNEAATALWTTEAWLLREEGPEEVLPAITKEQLHAEIESLDQSKLEEAFNLLRRLKGETGTRAA
ncbi:helix-turn-helix domain-containing protein [Bradyrhizobium sp. ORS 86]|uniref:helix-turn-helix domain-containing protein n=1 Tax=Bradyrhizobium sp. ORS 86 TaxID=1685970 RepID=UPI0038904E1D